MELATMEKEASSIAMVGAKSFKFTAIQPVNLNSQFTR